MRRHAREFHGLARWKGHVGSVPGAALALTVATLAVVRKHGLTRDFITDRAAGTSAGVSLAHACSPYSFVGSLRGHRASAFARLPKKPARRVLVFASVLLVGDS